MVAARSLVNALSLTRVGLALLFVLCFQRQPALLAIATGLCILAFVTDRLDGYIARRLRVASIHGRLWDSLGDKSFYVGTIIAFQGQGFLHPVLAWGLIVREVALYITRILFIGNLSKIEQTRPFTKGHGYFMCLTIILGLFGMYAEIRGLQIVVYPAMQATAFLALVCGLGSMIHYLRL